MTLITYDDLVTLVNSSQLVKGMQYRIIDYETLIDEYLVYDFSTDYFVGDVNSHPMNDTNDIVTFKEYDLGHHDYDIIVFADDESTLNENARAIQRGENMLEIYYGGNSYHIRPSEVNIDETGIYVNLEVQDPDTGEITTVRIPITITISMIWYVAPDGTAYPLYQNENGEWYYITNSGEKTKVSLPSGTKGNEIDEGKGESSGAATEAQVLYNEKLYTVYKSDKGELYWINVEKDVVYLNIKFGISPVNKWWYNDDKTYSASLYPTYKDDNGYYSIVYDVKYEKFVRIDVSYFDTQVVKNSVERTSTRDANDDYFDGANLRAWWLKYTIFNDKSTYSWARIPTVNMGKDVPILYKSGTNRYYVYTGNSVVSGGTTYYIWTFGTRDYYMLYSFDDIEMLSPQVIDVYHTDYTQYDEINKYKIWSGELHFYFDGTYNDTTTETWNNGLGTHFRIVNYNTAMTPFTSIQTIEGTPVNTFEWNRDIYSDFGKGVVFRMEDEHANVMPYDFKNIMFARIGIGGCITALPDYRDTLNTVSDGTYEYNVFDVMEYDPTNDYFISNNSYTTLLRSAGDLDSSGVHRVQHNFFESCMFNKYLFGVSVGAVGNIHKWGVLYSAYKHYFPLSGTIPYRYTFDDSRDVGGLWTPIDTSLYDIVYCNTCDIPYNTFCVLKNSSYFCYQSKYILPNNIFVGHSIVSNNKITGNSLWNTFIMRSYFGKDTIGIRNNLINESHITHTYNLFDSEIKHSICCAFLPVDTIKAVVNVNVDTSNSVFEVCDGDAINAVYKHCSRVYTNKVVDSVFDGVHLVFGQDISDSIIKNVSSSVISAIYDKTRGKTESSNIIDSKGIQTMCFINAELDNCTNVYFGKFEGLIWVGLFEMSNGDNVLFNKLFGNAGVYISSMQNVKVMTGINANVGNLTPLLIPTDNMTSDINATIVTRNSQGIVKIYNDGDQIP